MAARRPAREEEGRPGPLSRTAAGLAALRGMAVSLGVLALLGALAVLIVLELRRAPLDLRDISVPQALAARGYTSEVMRERLWLGIREVQQPYAAGPFAGRDRGFDLRDPIAPPSDLEIEIPDPQIRVAVGDLAATTRAVLGLPQPRVAGEVTCGDPDCAGAVTLSLRIVDRDGRAHRPRLPPFRPGDPEAEAAFFREVGLAALRPVAPYNAAAWLMDRPGRRDEAVAIARILFRTSDSARERARAALLLGSAALRADRWQAAVGWFDRATRLDACLPHPWMSRAVVLARAGDHAGADRRLAEALEAFPDFAQGWRARAMVLGAGASETPEAAGSLLEAALGHLDEAERHDPVDPHLWLARSNVLSQAGAGEDAEDAARIAALLAPGYPPADLALGTALLVQADSAARAGDDPGAARRRAAAERAFARALAADPAQTSVSVKLALTRQSLGRPAAAAAALRAAREHLPRADSAELRVATILMRQARARLPAETAPLLQEARARISAMPPPGAMPDLGERRPDC